MSIIKNLFKQPEKKSVQELNTDFVKSIDFTKNPFENEQPEKVRIYDINGNEVGADE